jgi:hypothetical protein
MTIAVENVTPTIVTVEIESVTIASTHLRLRRRRRRRRRHRLRRTMIAADAAIARIVTATTDAVITTTTRLPLLLLPRTRTIAAGAATATIINATTDVTGIIPRLQMTRNVAGAVTTADTVPRDVTDTATTTIAILPMRTTASAAGGYRHIRLTGL